MLSGTAFALKQRLPTGLLTSVSTTIGGTPSGTLTVYILNDHGSNSFSVSSSFTVTPSGVGLNTFYAGGDFDPIEVESGQLLAFFSAAALSCFNPAGLDGYFQLSGSPSSSPSTWAGSSSDTLDFSANIRVSIPPSQLSAPLMAKLENAYAFSQANSQLLSLGLSGLGGGSHVASGLAVALPSPMPQGTIQSISLGTFGGSAGVVTILVLNRATNGDFSLARSFVLTASAGHQTFAVGVDFDPFQIAPGQYLGLQSSSVLLAFAGGGDGCYELDPYGTVPTATPSSWSFDSSLTLDLSVSVRGNTQPVTTTSAASFLSGGKTLLDSQSFPGPTLPDGWQQAGGWTLATGGGIVSPSSGQGYTCYAYSSKIINVEKRTYRMSFQFLAANSIFGLFSTQPDGKDLGFGTQILVDAVAGNLIINNAYSGTAHNTGAAASVALGFTAALNTAYLLQVTMDRRVMTVSISDPVSGLTTSLASGSNSATNTDQGGGASAGAMFDGFGFQCIGGQVKVTQSIVFANAKCPRALFLGDSITHGAGVTANQRWAQLVANKTGNCLISGRSGCSSDNSLAKCSTELPYLLPEYLVLMIGSNDAVPGNIGLAGWQNNYMAMIQQAQGLGVKVIACAIPPRGDVSQSIINSFNAWLLARTDVTLVRMDLALTVNHDGVTQNTALFQSDTIHPNAAGSIAMAARFAVDAPRLLDASIIAGQQPPLIDTVTGLPYRLTVANGVVTPVPY